MSGGSRSAGASPGGEFSVRRGFKGMRLITHAGVAVALVVNGDLALFDAELDERGFYDPLVRFTAAMCRLAMGIELGVADGRYAEARGSATPAHC